MKLADTPPTYCASCFLQQPDKKYVDFESYWDGPTLDSENQIKVPIDDLIICEECLSAGASLIGMIHNKRMTQENFELGRALDAKNEYIESLEKIISDLDHTVGEVLSSNAKRGSGRPQLRIPKTEEEKQVA